MYENRYKYLLIYYLLMFGRMCYALTNRKNYIKESRLSIYLGSWQTLLGGPPHYFEFISVMWNIHFIVCFFTIFSRSKAEFSWMQMFGAIHGYIDHDSIGMDDKILARSDISCNSKKL